MVLEVYSGLPDEFQNLKVDIHILMPNHFHCILSVIRVDTRPAPTVGDIVCAFKSKTTNEYIKGVQQGIYSPFRKRIWQRNFYEHVIRNEQDYLDIWEYIDSNPAKWLEDEYHGEQGRASCPPMDRAFLSEAKDLSLRKEVSMDFSEELRDKLIEKGAAIVGYADLTALPANIRGEFNYGVSIAVALNPAIVSEIPSGPHLDYYEEYKNVNSRLRGLCDYAAALITEKGFRALPVRIKQDGNYRTPLPYKTTATLAGVGWIGKNALLVTEKYGSAVRLTSVLTDMPFQTGTPFTESRCGACTQCVSLCPAKAIGGKTWHVGVDRDELVDPFACKAAVIKRGEPFALTEATCGMCIAVCPYTQKYIRTIKRGDCLEPNI